jgi:hypothetical protein
LRVDAAHGSDAVTTPFDVPSPEYGLPPVELVLVLVFVLLEPALPSSPPLPSSLLQAMKDETNRVNRPIPFMVVRIVIAGPPLKGTSDAEITYAL